MSSLLLLRQMRRGGVSAAAAATATCTAVSGRASAASVGRSGGSSRGAILGTVSATCLSSRSWSSSSSESSAPQPSRRRRARDEPVVEKFAAAGGAFKYEIVAGDLYREQGFDPERPVSRVAVALLAPEQQPQGDGPQPPVFIGQSLAEGESVMDWLSKIQTKMNENAERGHPVTAAQLSQVEPNMVVVGGNGVDGASPMALLLMGLGACSSVDLVSIMRKQRTPLDMLIVTVTGQRATEGARPFERIHMDFFALAEAQVLDGKKLLRATDLSVEKHCGAHATLSQAAEITHSIRIPAPHLAQQQ